MTHLYFGRPWRADSRTAIQVAPPVGHPCAQCGERITTTDRGGFRPALRCDRGALVEVMAPVHMECEIRCAVGSLAHLHGGRPWQGTYRQEAHRVVAMLNDIRRRSQWDPL